MSKQFSVNFHQQVRNFNGGTRGTGSNQSEGTGGGIGPKLCGQIHGTEERI